MPLLLLLAQVVAPMEYSVAIASEAQAKAMTPQALGDAILRTGHPPIDHVHVGPLGMEPPPPPGAPPQFPVMLETRPEPAEQGYCQRTRIEARIVNPGPVPTVVLDSTEQRYRFGADCVGGEAVYGAYQDAKVRSVIRDFDRARRARRWSFEITYVDELPAGDWPRYASSAQAARDLPLHLITVAADPHRMGSIPKGVTNALPSGEGVDNVAFYGGNRTTGIITREQGRITRVWIRSRIPPPF